MWHGMGMSFGRRGFHFQGPGWPRFGFYFGDRPFGGRRGYLRMLERYQEDLEEELEEVKAEIQAVKEAQQKEA